MLPSPLMAPFSMGHMGHIVVNEWLEIRDSVIHGSGAFARSPIPGGQRIIEYVGEKITKSESNRRGLALYEQSQKTGGASVYIFDLNKRYDLDGNHPDNHARLINHSCEPNCEAVNLRGRIYIYSKRDVKQGEELTFDYGYGLEHFLDHPCRCGAKSCPGYIVGADYRPKLRRMLSAKKARAKAS